MTDTLQWHKLPKPVVTICCKSLKWAETNLGTLCHVCGKITHDGRKQAATAEDMRANGIGWTDQAYDDAYE